MTAYLTNNPLALSELPAVLRAVHAALATLGQPAHPEAPAQPVPMRKSMTLDYLVCLEDGKKLKMLKRHLRNRYDLSPEEYRARWNLPADYPMVAPSYAERRSQFVKEIGLGRHRPAEPEPGPVTKGRRKTAPRPAA